MGQKTEIEWTDATWNPVTGCTKVSPGCKNCYAERVFPRAYGKERKFTDVRCHPERLDQPLRWRRPRKIFVNSMSDLFHESVPESFIDQVWAVMLLSPRHTFQILTKRPQRMKDYLQRGPRLGCLKILECANALRRERPKLTEIGISDPSFCPAKWIWLGVSAENQQTFETRWQLLRDTPAAVRFISLEPLIAPVDLHLNCPIRFYPGEPASYDREADLVITGGESGPNARPAHPDWFRSVRDQCQAAGVPFFFKQHGEWETCADGQPGTHLICQHAHIQEVPFKDVTEDCFVKIVESQTTRAARPGWRCPQCLEQSADFQDEAGYWHWRMKWIRFKSGERVICGEMPKAANACPIARIGKKAAGRLLDGREWNEFPEVP